jgi:adenylate cyclase
MRKVIMRSIKLLALLAIVVVALLHARGTLSIPVLDQLDRMWYDARIQNLPNKGVHQQIVIIDIDEKSLAEIGRWPWGRDKLAQLTTELLQRQKIAVLGFDVVFTEPDVSSGLVHLQRLADGPLKANSVFQKQVDLLSTILDFDGLLAQAVAGQPVVLGYYFTSDREGEQDGQLPKPVMDGGVHQGRFTSGLRWTGYGANLDRLAQSAPLAGFFNVIPDEDGVVRALPLVTQFNGVYYESLALAMFRAMLELPTVHIVMASGKAQAIELKANDRALTVPVDDRLAAWIPYRGTGYSKGGAFRYISAADVLKGRLPAESLQSQLVLVGSTAPGLQDLRATPVASVYPGVEIHANMLAGLLDEQNIITPDYSKGFNAAQILVVGLLLLLGGTRLGAGRLLALGFVVFIVVIAVNTAMWSQFNLVLPVATALALTVVLLTFQVGLGYFTESRSKRNLATLFSAYVPPELVAKMVKEPEHYSMQAQNAELTVMFCDMRGFTALSETMQPEALQVFINQIFSRLSHVIRNDYQGTIDKYMGDCIMAFWGAPVHTDQHANLAVQAAMQMVQVVKDFNTHHQTLGLPYVGVGIGINTGLMCVGDMGSDIRRSYTVIGDAVNLGARLEGLCKTYGVDIIVSEATKEQATNWYWQQLDTVRVKGKAQPVAIYQPLAERKASVTQPDANLESIQHELARWKACFEHYRKQEWSACMTYLLQLQQKEPEKHLYRLYAQRVDRLQSLPYNPAWDAVTDFDSK